MGNNEHEAILRRGVEDWNRWRKEHPDVRIDFTRARLSGADLAGANLERAIFVDALMDAVNLQRANLQGADLQFAAFWPKEYWGRVTLANLEGANLNSAVVNHADLQGANLRNADLQNANLYNANLRRSNLQGANLRAATLKRADLRGANLQGAQFSGVILTDTAFDSGSDLLDLQWTSLFVNGTIYERTAVERGDQILPWVGPRLMLILEGPRASLDTLEKARVVTDHFQSLGIDARIFDQGMGGTRLEFSVRGKPETAIDLLFGDETRLLGAGDQFIGEALHVLRKHLPEAKVSGLTDEQIQLLVHVAEKQLERFDAEEVAKDAQSTRTFLQRFVSANKSEYASKGAELAVGQIPIAGSLLAPLAGKVTRQIIEKK